MKDTTRLPLWDTGEWAGLSGSRSVSASKGTAPATDGLSQPPLQDEEMPKYQLRLTARKNFLSESVSVLKKTIFTKSKKNEFYT